MVMTNNYDLVISRSDTSRINIRHKVHSSVEEDMNFGLILHINRLKVNQPHY